MNFPRTIIIKIVTDETPHELSAWNFDNLCIWMCHKSQDWVSPGYHFATAGDNIQGCNFKYFCIINKKTPYGVN